MFPSLSKNPTIPEVAISASRSRSMSQGCAIDLESIDCDGILVTLPDSNFPALNVTEVDPRSLPEDPDAKLGSRVYDVSFVDETSKDFSVELCISSSSETDACLGYLDEKVFPPKWKCEDECLNKNANGQLCGSTSHFTNFAILLGGGGSGEDGCESFNTYVTGSFYGDLALCLAVAGTCVCCGIIFIGFTFTPCGKKLVMSDEAKRVNRMRSHMSRHLTTKDYNTTNVDVD